MRKLLVFIDHWQSVFLSTRFDCFVLRFVLVFFRFVCLFGWGEGLFCLVFIVAVSFIGGEKNTNLSQVTDNKDMYLLHVLADK
jgi:hypothetical protein